MQRYETEGMITVQIPNTYAVSIIVMDNPAWLYNVPVQVRSNVSFDNENVKEVYICQIRSEIYNQKLKWDIQGQLQK